MSCSLPCHYRGQGSSPGSDASWKTNKRKCFFFSCEELCFLVVANPERIKDSSKETKREKLAKEFVR